MQFKIIKRYSSGINMIFIPNKKTLPEGRVFGCKNLRINSFDFPELLQGTIHFAVKSQKFLMMLFLPEP
jgi:hypothetical protein